MLAGLGAAAGLSACGGDDEALVRALQAQTATIPSAQDAASTAPPGAVAPPAAPGTTAPAPATAAQAASDAPATAPQPEPAAATMARRPQARWTVHVTRPAILRASPGGRVIGRVRATTEFDSPTVLAVVRRSGPWLGILTPALPNGRIGWISVRSSLQAHRNDWRIDAFLRRHQVVVQRGGRVVSRIPVAIGAPRTPTPQGLYAVTDKLRTTNSSSPYGCCILALTGHQTQTPQGWGGGDRIAIHATDRPDTIGSAASAGCLRAPASAVRRLVATVPLGTLVRVHP